MVASLYRYDERMMLLSSPFTAMVRTAPLPIDQIHRPFYAQNDPAKVAALMESIQAIGLQEPIEVLEVEGHYYGFSGCHRYEACTRLGHETILCRIRRAPRSVLQRHLA
jgi:sulfiredoxin